MDETWTIGELAGQAADALLAGGSAARQLSGRVREVPNDRLIRWYVTVGLVDPPLSRTGRIARYGRRHLLQLVAIKRRQAEGRTLAEIQAELVGATSSYLESVAALRSDEPAQMAQPALLADPGGGAEGAEGRRFWAREPRAAAAGPVVRTLAVAAAAGPLPRLAGKAAQGADGSVQAFRLAPGVVVVLDGGGPGLRPDDLAELRRAAAPLVSLLATHGHCQEPDDEERERP